MCWARVLPASLDTQSFKGTALEWNSSVLRENRPVGVEGGYTQVEVSIAKKKQLKMLL